MLLWFILAAVILFIAVLLVRAALFTPEKESKETAEEVSFDRKAATESLAALVKCRTVSYYDHSLENEAEFQKLTGMLEDLYPNVMQSCPLQKFDGRALLFCWKGKNRGPASVLMAHYDVVPVEEENWSVPPFDALIRDGAMWGRGTLDTKVTFNGILFAAETLLKQGFMPEHDIYFAFSGGEEVNGPGAENIVDYFERNQIELSMVVDEGGAVVQDVFPGVKKPCGLIGIAEKGLMNLEFSVKSSGGHASAPAPHTPVGILSRACVRVESHPFRYHITKPVFEMFDTLGRHSSFLYRMIFANLWCFGGVLDLMTKKSGGELNALLRTTVAFTQMEGSAAPNVIPPSAKMVANLRLNPEDTVESAVQYIRETVGDDHIQLSYKGEDPSAVSRTDCDVWERVKKAVADTWKGCIVAPYLMVQCSDSRHYGKISDKVYKFSAMDLTAEERHTIHGNDEHIRLETLYRAVEFFMRLIKLS